MAITSVFTMPMKRRRERGCRRFQEKQIEHPEELLNAAACIKNGKSIEAHLLDCALPPRCICRWDF
jgi:hypothetical protein